MTLNSEFSILNGSTDNLVDSMQNTVNSIQQSIIDTNNQQGTVNNGTNTTNKLPQTGDFFELEDALTLICIVSSILLVAILIKDIKYKNINKK